MKISPQDGVKNNIGVAGKINSFREVSHNNQMRCDYFYVENGNPPPARSPSQPPTAVAAVGALIVMMNSIIMLAKPILIEIETISSGCNSRPVAANIIRYYSRWCWCFIVIYINWRLLRINVSIKIQVSPLFTLVVRHACVVGGGRLGNWANHTTINIWASNIIVFFFAVCVRVFCI